VDLLTKPLDAETWADFARLAATRQAPLGGQPVRRLSPTAEQVGSPLTWLLCNPGSVAGTRYARILFAGCAAALTAALGVTTAFAATTWTIKPGGAITAKSATATFNDTKHGGLFTCTSLSASGRLKTGSGLAGSHAGSISAVDFGRCTSPLGRFRAPRVDIVWTVQAAGLPWHLNLVSDDRGVVRGTISHIEIKVSTVVGCSAVIDGTSGTATDGIVRFRYASSTGHLTVLAAGGNLHAYNVSGCFGLVNNGDPVTISATFTLNPEQTITSP
jgi:hypothetical protein